MKRDDLMTIFRASIAAVDPRDAVRQHQRTAEVLGYRASILMTDLKGEAREAARFLAAQVRTKGASMPGSRPRCLLFGGETTVAVKGGGIGGRNQELALAFALEIDGEKGVTLLSAGTDGIDGPTDAAGAIANGNTASRARALGIDPARYLIDNDSYTFFKRYDSLSGEQNQVITGPTGTNVMDIQILLIRNGQDKNGTIPAEEVFYDHEGSL